MSETVVKKVSVSFNDGLPLGTHATFKHNGEMWTAFPSKKYAAITTVTDRLIGALANIRGQMTRWVSSHPEDAERVVMILQTIARANEFEQQAIQDKTKARTQ